MHYLSLVAIVKNEHPYIKEFIHFYRLNGVDHFYFYDNESEPPLKEVLTDYASICTVIPIPGEQKQTTAYNHYIRHFGKESVWAAFFDIDEFILTKQHSSIKHYLETLPFASDCVSVNWVIFGNGGHEKQPEGGFVIDHYRYSEGKQHKNVKSIVKTAAVRKFDHPHFPKLKFFRKHTNAKGDKMKGAENVMETTDVIQLNHYFTKSLEEFQRKLHSKRPDNGVIRAHDKEAMKWLVSEPERCSVAYDDEICTKFLSKLEERFSESFV